MHVYPMLIWVFCVSLSEWESVLGRTGAVLAVEWKQIGNFNGAEIKWSWVPCLYLAAL